MASRVEWIDCAKVWTMILVVLGHSYYYDFEIQYGHFPCSFDINAVDICMSYKLLTIIKRIIYMFHMPLFMMLSGACFELSNKNTTSFILYIKKKSKRLLFPFIIVTVFISVPLKYVSGYWNFSENVIYDIILGQFVLLGSTHLWFIVCLFWVSIIYYLLKKGVKKHLFFIVVLLYIIGVLLPINDYFCFKRSLKYILFFYLGSEFYYLIKDEYITPTIVLFTSAFFLGGIYYQLFLYTHPIVNVIVIVVTAICGSYLMCIIAYYSSYKIDKLLLKIPFYNSLYHHSYDYYLYSDCINCLFILIATSSCGAKVVCDNSYSILTYLLRTFVQFAFAYYVILMFKRLRVRVVGHC